MNLPKFKNIENIVSVYLYKFPKLRKIIIFLYKRFFAILNLKKNSHKSKHEIITIGPKFDNTFFGYYDCIPSNKKGLILSHHTKYPTNCLPNKDIPILISVFDINKPNIPILTTYSYAYNWQQGSRLSWLNDTNFIYNDFDFIKKKYISNVYSLKSNRIIKSFSLPNYAVHLNKFFLSLNTERLTLLQNDYGYYNTPPMTLKKSKVLCNDGITYVDIQSCKSRLLFSLEDCYKLLSKYINTLEGHVINHLLISDSGEKIIFLYRVISNTRRLDFLMKYDLLTSELNLIIKPCLISHFCWIDDNNLLVFMYLNNISGSYYKVNIKSSAISKIFVKNNFSISDGHPSRVNSFEFISDTYPDRSRNQKLLLLNTLKNNIEVIAVFYNSPKFCGNYRCDMHPRYDKHNNKIFFDSVHKGERKLNFIDYNY